MTVEEILHGGEYTDRRGRRWTRTHRNNWSAPRRPRVSALADEDQIRQLIEHDMHRDVCPRLSECKYHPRPHILTWEEVSGWFMVFEPNAYFERRYFGSLPDAMEAARALAVSE